MIRLGLLVLALLAVIAVTMIAVGPDGDSTATVTPTEEPRPTAQDPETRKLIEQIKTSIAPNDDAQPEEAAPAVVQANRRHRSGSTGFPARRCAPRPNMRARKVSKIAPRICAAPPAARSFT